VENLFTSWLLREGGLGARVSHGTLILLASVTAGFTVLGVEGINGEL